LGHAKETSRLFLGNGVTVASSAVFEPFVVS
jgi:hypothetical protein